jgi:protein involved in polysaccharide export with SLBB domain
MMEPTPVAQISNLLYRCCSVVFVLLFVAGCTTKAKAKAHAQAAFAAGQQQAMALMNQPRGTHVTVIGQVRTPMLPWSEDLTLAKAIIAAGYYGAADPKEIFIVRNGKASRVDPKQLLNGEDVPLQAGDVVQIK